MGGTEWAILIALSILWGASFFFNEIAVAHLPVLTIVALRVGLAAAALWGVVAVLGRSAPRGREVWLSFLGMGVLNNALPFLLIVYGQTTIASGLASILNATTPLFAVLVAGALLADERMTRTKLGGVGLGLGGVVVIVGPGALAGLGGDVRAELACLGGALAYACAGVYGRRFRRLGVPPLMVAVGQVTASAALLIPLAAIIDGPWSYLDAPASAWWAVTGLAVPSTALAYILYFALLARAGATNVLLVTFLVPVSALALGLLILGERLGAGELAGMALIAAGLAAIDGRLLGRR